MAEADEVQRVYSVEELIAGLNVDLLPGGIVVEVPAVHVDVDAPEGIHEVSTRTEPDLKVVVDVRTGEPLDRSDSKGSAPIAKSRVELACTVSGDAHPQVARQREDGKIILVGSNMTSYDGVQAPAYRAVSPTCVSDPSTRMFMAEGDGGAVDAVEPAKDVPPGLPTSTEVSAVPGSSPASPGFSSSAALISGVTLLVGRLDLSPEPDR